MLDKFLYSISFLLRFFIEKSSYFLLKKDKGLTQLFISEFTNGFSYTVKNFKKEIIL